MWILTYSRGMIFINIFYRYIVEFLQFSNIYSILENAANKRPSLLISRQIDSQSIGKSKQ